MSCMSSECCTKRAWSCDLWHPNARRAEALPARPQSFILHICKSLLTAFAVTNLYPDKNLQNTELAFTLYKWAFQGSTFFGTLWHYFCCWLLFPVLMGADGGAYSLAVRRRNAIEACVSSADACGWQACIIQRLNAVKMMCLPHTGGWTATKSSHS